MAFYTLWAHAPSLHAALVALQRQGWRGVVHGGVDRNPHIEPTLTDGWRGLQKGLPQSVIDLKLAAPTMALTAWVGYQLRPLLVPITLRAEPLSPQAKAALGTAALTLGACWLLTRDRRQ